jgi:hypothetical protein
MINTECWRGAMQREVQSKFESVRIITVEVVTEMNEIVAKEIKLF